MNLSTDHTVSLEEEDIYEFELTGIPLFVYLVILCIIGTIGNLHVIIVYSSKYNANIYKTFILCLAGVDFLACTLSIPLVLFIVMHPNTIQSSAFCKFSRASSYFTGACSLSLLNVVAIERFRKVCQATRSQFTLRTARIASAVVIVVVFTIAVIPVTIIYGINTKNTRYHSLIGYECTVLDEFKTSTFAKIYRAIIFVAFVVLLVVCVILYGLIGRKIYIHQKKQASSTDESRGSFSRRQNHESKEHTEDDSKPSTGDTDTSGNHGSSSSVMVEVINICAVDKNDIHLVEKSFQEPNTFSNDLNCKDSYTSHEKTKEEHLTTDGDDNKKNLGDKRSVGNFSTKRIGNNLSTKRAQKLTRSRNITMIFLVVSVISFGGYLPYLIITLIRNVDWQGYDAFSHSAPALDLFIRWMFFLNNAVNPLVYGFMDRKFRKECAGFYYQMKGYICSVKR